MTWHFDRVHAGFHYQGVIRHSIVRLKYHGDFAQARLLGQLLADRVQDVPRPALLIPIPLHRQRFRQRQFNQSLELARVLSACLEVPVMTGAVKRIRATAQQTHLPAKQRWRNLNNAFCCEQDLQGADVAIVDDVMTTGATANALAAALRAAGAGRVEVWVVARAG
ncbi:MAG: phosphoribosyltransferase family protein [Methylococcales bacterium]|nr:phosphoribosyltransferase family protein [Methylococcales bacterium]